MKWFPRLMTRHEQIAEEEEDKCWDCGSPELDADLKRCRQCNIERALAMQEFGWR